MFDVEKFKALLVKSKRAAIFTHPFPDPDAIGSMMAIKWLLNKSGIQSNSYYTGTISHPQNRSMVNLLDPELEPLDNYCGEKDIINILVDTVPSNVNLNDCFTINFDLIIDHHKETPVNFNGIYVNLKAGSTCATVYHIINQLNINFDEDNQLDNKVATAMMIGIITDTENLMSDDCSDYEFEAWSGLFPFRDSVLLKQIVNFERPKFWIDSKAIACSKAVVEESIGVVGMGLIPAKHRDMVADMADEMVTWEDINTAVVFALIEGSRIEGCVRTKASSVSVPALCQDLGGKYGKGGGKLGKGAYRYDLAGASLDEDEDEEIKQQSWELFEKKEIRRVFKIIRNK
jgi:nanoRNase/pAp phosphatase (c-di-AMP/oligoRNAs hydrolase)